MFYGDQLVYLLVCLLHEKTMALKNFSFRENWVRSKVAGMKTAFFVIFDPTWAHILAPKRPKYGILSAELEFPVPWKDRSYIIT